MAKQLELPGMGKKRCVICAQMYGQWVAQQMKARAGAQKRLLKGDHPYDHPTAKLSEDPPEA